jgi:hypothetical protein
MCDQLGVDCDSRWTKLIVLRTPIRELLYSSQAPSVSLHHDLDANSFEPFHSMAETIGSRLHELLLKQFDGIETEDIDMDSNTKTTQGL